MGVYVSLSTILKKLHIIKTGSTELIKGSKSKTKDERKVFWSDMMDQAIKDGDRLKASELLGRSEADFTDTIKHGVDESMEDILRRIKSSRGEL
jgi:hypothetical protein